MWFSKWDPQYHSKSLVSILTPHGWFILSLCLQNNMLVILILLSFILDGKASNNCMGPHFFKFENH